MQDLRLDNNKLSGPLPYMWTAEDSFPKLQTLQLQNNQLDGPLAQSWGRMFGLRALRVLLLSQNLLQGPLPADWAAPGTFQQLLTLKIDNNMLTGALPAVRHHSALKRVEAQWGNCICWQENIATGDHGCKIMVLISASRGLLTRAG